MFNVADIVVIAIVIIAIFMGYKKGFIKTLFGVLSFFIAIAITFTFYKPVMELIKERTGFEEWLYGYLYEMNLEDKNAEEVSGEQVVLSESGENYINNLPDAIVKMIGLDEFKENAKVTVIEKIVEFVVKLLAIVIVYMVSKLILLVLVLVLDSIAKLPVLKQFNELLGLVLGGMLGFIQVYVVCAIITLIGSLPALSGICSIISNSLIAHIFYDNNLLLKILF